MGVQKLERQTTKYIELGVSAPFPSLIVLLSTLKPIFLQTEFSIMQLCQDNNFGPTVGPSCRGDFDFTLLFEQSFLSIVPSAILIILFPLRVRYLLREDIKLNRWPKKANLLARLVGQTSEPGSSFYASDWRETENLISSYLPHLLA